jgi:hypothetical protein
MVEGMVMREDRDVVSSLAQHGEVQFVTEQDGGVEFGFPRSN